MTQVQEHSAAALVVRRTWVGRWIGAWMIVEILLVFLDYHIDYRERVPIGSIQRLADMANEKGLANWFAVTQAFLIALTFCGAAVLVRSPQAARRGWTLVAVYFCWLALDKGTRLREVFGGALDALAARGPAFPWWPAETWQMMFLPLYAVCGVLVLVFLRAQCGLGRGRSWLVATAACFVLAGAIDLDLALADAHPWNAITRITERVDLSAFTEARFGKEPERTLRHFARVGREYLELLGATLIWWLALRHLARAAPRLRIRFERDAPGARA